MKIIVTAQVGQAYVPFLREKLKPVRALLVARDHLTLHDMSIVLVNDQRMSTLHKTFMNIAGPTDVLTFPMDDDKSGEVTSGEVYVCLGEAKRQAKTHGIPVKNELLLYAIHGLLHLLGYDDRTERGYRAMHRLEDKLLTQLGLGPVFAGPGRTTDPPIRRTARRKQAGKRKEGSAW